MNKTLFLYVMSAVRGITGVNYNSITKINSQSNLKASDLFIQKNYKFRKYVLKIKLYISRKYYNSSH